MRRLPLNQNHFTQRSPHNGADGNAGGPLPHDSAKIAIEIGIAALALAKRAQAAGLPTIGYLLESVALEAGAEAAQLQPRDDA